MTVTESVLPTWPKMLKAIVRLANDNQSSMDGTVDSVYRIMDGSQVVWAVWQDPTQELGVGNMVVKGIEHLEKISRQGVRTKTSWTAISCIEHAQALALERVYAAREAQSGTRLGH